MKNDIIAIVVTYNRLNKLKQCISTIETQKTQCDILIINNNSTDKTAEWIEKYNSNNKIHVFTTETNIGGAGGFNIGIKKAYELGYKYMWLMDDDCFVHNETLQNLINAADKLDDKFGWLSSVSLWIDNNPCLMNKQKISKNFYDKINLLTDSLLAATQATFVSLLITRMTIKKIGLPIKDFFIWGDDIEFTRRIAVRKNIPSYIVGNSIVTHAMEENNGSNIATDSADRINRYKYAYRNEAFLFRQEGIYGIMYFITKCFYNIFRILTKSSNNKIKRLYILIKSSIYGLIWYSPKIETITENENIRSKC